MVFGRLGSRGTAPGVAPEDACQPLGTFAKLLWLGVPYPYHFQAGAALWAWASGPEPGGTSVGRKACGNIGTGTGTGTKEPSILVGLGSDAFGAEVKTRSGSYQGALRLL